MDTAKLVEKLEKFFDLSKKKQLKKHDKYMEVIRKLEKKKFQLEQKAQKGRVNDATGRPNQALMRELQVISRLIDKAKQQDLAD